MAAGQKKLFSHLILACSTSLGYQRWKKNDQIYQWAGSDSKRKVMQLVTRCCFGCAAHAFIIFWFYNKLQNIARPENCIQKSHHIQYIGRYNTKECLTMSYCCRSWPVGRSDPMSDQVRSDLWREAPLYIKYDCNNIIDNGLHDGGSINSTPCVAVSGIGKGWRMWVQVHSCKEPLEEHFQK